MTLGIFFIGLLALIGIAVFVKGYILENGGEQMFLGVVVILIAGAITVARSGDIEDDKLKALCITQGKEVVEVLGTKVCRL